jgi:hypothetical protein
MSIIFGSGMVITTGSAIDLSQGSNTNIVYTDDGTALSYFVQSTGSVSTFGSATVIG